MTEVEWQTRNYSLGMLVFMERKASGRKFRLFMLACCRRVWHVLSEQYRRAVELAERFADGESCSAEMDAACEQAYQATKRHEVADDSKRSGVRSAENAAIRSIRSSVTPLDPIYVDDWVKSALADERSSRKESLEHRKVVENDVHCNLIRCLFGNPFCPMNIADAIRTGDIAGLAQAAYDERIMPSGELDQMRVAVLADALEESGISGSLVDHLRGSGPHVRGCHVIDMVTGRN